MGEVCEEAMIVRGPGRRVDVCLASELGTSVCNSRNFGAFRVVVVPFLYAVNL